jgi:hypothetical protein
MQDDSESLSKPVMIQARVSECSKICSEFPRQCFREANFVLRVLE